MNEDKEGQVSEWVRRSEDASKGTSSCCSRRMSEKAGRTYTCRDHVQGCKCARRRPSEVNARRIIGLGHEPSQVWSKQAKSSRVKGWFQEHAPQALLLG